MLKIIMIAPEIIEEKGYKATVDIFSLGAIAFFLVYRQYPFNSFTFIEDVKN